VHGRVVQAARAAGFVRLFVPQGTSSPSSPVAPVSPHQQLTSSPPSLPLTQHPAPPTPATMSRSTRSRMRRKREELASAVWQEEGEGCASHRALDVVTSFMFCCYDLGEAPLGLALLSLQLWDWWMAFRAVAVRPRLCWACGRSRKGQDDGTRLYVNAPRA
jgi:hypothetical protein